MATVTNYILIISVLCLAFISSNCTSKSPQTKSVYGKTHGWQTIKNNLLKMRRKLCQKSTTGQKPVPGVHPESSITTKFLINSMYPDTFRLFKPKLTTDTWLELQSLFLYDGLYEGLFKTNTTIESMRKAMRTKTKGSQRQSRRCSFIQNVSKRNDLQMDRSPRAVGDDDQDMCCRTRVSQFPNSTLVNVNGVTRDVVQIPNENMYQYIPHGFCAGKSPSCTGWCVQIYQLHFVLVTNPKGGVLFEAFSIPSYCSCKNIGC